MHGILLVAALVLGAPTPARSAEGSRNVEKSPVTELARPRSADLRGCRRESFDELSASGTIDGVQADRLTLQGQAQPLYVGPSTMIMRAGQAISIDALQPGDEVRASYRLVGPRQVAQTLSALPGVPVKGGASGPERKYRRPDDLSEGALARPHGDIAPELGALE